MSLLDTFRTILGADSPRIPPGYIPAPRREPNGRFISSRPDTLALLLRECGDLKSPKAIAAREYAKQRRGRGK